MGMLAPEPAEPAKPAKPAQRPERVVETEAEDVVLGTAEDEPGDLKIQGKRALIKPSGGASAGGASGLNV